MDEQPLEDNSQKQHQPPQLPPDLPPEAMADSITSNEVEPPRGFLAGFGGALLFILLIGLIIGPLLWWVWTRSPLRLWLKIIITILPIAILAAVV